MHEHKKRTKEQINTSKNPIQNPIMKLLMLCCSGLTLLMPTMVLSRSFHQPSLRQLALPSSIDTRRYNPLRQYQQLPLVLVNVRGGSLEDVVPGEQQTQTQQGEEEAKDTTNNGGVTVPATMDRIEPQDSLQQKQDDDEHEPQGTTAIITNNDNGSPNDNEGAAANLRQRAKVSHDTGDYVNAAQLFSQAADLLQAIHSSSSPMNHFSGDNHGNDDHHGDNFDDQAATCRLHQALCYLKSGNHDGCIQVCTDLLEVAESSPSSSSGAIRARALYRRCKAYVGLDQWEEALQDARLAAFLGDRKAVALYGKLMREHGGGGGSSHVGGQGTTDPAMLQDLFAGKNPFQTMGSSNQLFESMLNKSPSSSNPMASLLSGNTGGSLAKSVLSNLTKKLETESDTICKYLNSASKEQLQSMAAMGGVPLSDSHASTIVKFCKQVTPKRIQFTVKTSKRVWYVIALVRKTTKLISKYKFVLVAWFVLAWIQASIVRPIPINTKAAIQAAKAAAVTATR